MNQRVLPVILCGGAGTRLWPLSNADKPKQLLPLVSENTMLQDTLLRLRSLEVDVAAPVIVCSERYAPLVAAQGRALGDPVGAIVLEPKGRNSAPAVAVAALMARELERGGDPILLVLPADHVIGSPESFAAAVAAALVPAGDDYLTTFGVVPTEPATGYGYIRRGNDRGGWSEVAQFVEKPDAATARSYLASGDFFWNSGMFLFRASTWLRELGKHAPDILAACEQAMTRADRLDGLVRLGADFSACRADSIDYAVMEKTSRAAVVPLAARWSDVGSWSSLHDAVAKDADNNFARGDVILDSCRNTYASAQHRLVAAIGVEGVAIIETEDAVLVVAREHAEAVKRVAELVAKRVPPR